MSLVTPDQRRRLREAIFDQFPDSNEFDRVLDDEIGQTLAKIAIGINLEDLYFKFVQWACVDTTARLLPVLRRAVKERPNHGELKQLLIEIELPHPDHVIDDKPEQTEASEAIRAYIRIYDERRVHFNAMKAYKSWHDVLHKIQNNMKKILADFEIAKSNPGTALNEIKDESIPELLNNLAGVPRQSLEDLPELESPPDWVAPFEGQIRAILMNDPKTLKNEIYWLKTLPLLQMTQLNFKILEKVSAIRLGDLTSHLEQIVSELELCGKPNFAKLRGRVNLFCELCYSILNLSDTHNRCQRMYDILRESEGLQYVTADAIYFWDSVPDHLESISRIFPENRPIKKMIEAAKQFEASNDQDAFYTLVEKFTPFFTETDTKLLDFAKDLPTKSSNLSDALKEFE